MSRTLSCDVLVIGLGPVGATLSALLGDAGIEVCAIDKSLEVYPLPRAAHFDHEIMRTFQQLGIGDEVLRHARPIPGYEFRSASGEVLVSFGDMTAQFAASGWAGGYMFNQPGLERALRAKLATQPNVQVMLGASFERLTIESEGVHADLSGAHGPLRVHARYVVGCDGASSAVRGAMRSKLEDLEFDEPWLVIDAIPRPGARMPAVNLQICDPARPTTCVLMGPGRHRWEFMLLPGETAEQVLTDAFIAGLLAKWDADVDIDRKAVYRFHGLVADRWRSGPVLIAGDAAHQTPPFAGQGMCAGIRDAANLAWKLDAVLHGDAADALLDTYQREREPNARAYIELAIEMGRVVCTLDPERAQARDAQLLAARKAGVSALPPASPPPLSGAGVLAATPAAGTLFPQAVALHDETTTRLDDVLGPGPWLITARQIPPVPEITTVSIDDPRLLPFARQLESWFAKHSVAAVLVRPDRYIFGCGDPEVLLRSWVQMLTGTKRASKAGAER